MLVFLDITCAVLLLEPLDSPGSIDILLFARIERMAHRANLCMDFLCRAASFESVATATANRYLIIFWMYLFFHNTQSLKNTLKKHILAILLDISIYFFAKVGYGDYISVCL